MFGTRPLTPNSAGITAPMNINAVIAHLVEMTPPQRKQFAQMHMDDPMMLSAAKFVDNQISKQAQAMAAQQMGAAPPPVNQQVVAQMSPQPPAPQAAPMPQATPQDEGQAQPMPEESGIAQLPAQNMPSEYAAGGIVAFADGGGPVNGVYVPNTVPPGAFIMGNMWKDPETGETGYLPGRGPGKGLSGYEGMTMGDIATKAKEKLEDLLVSGTYAKQKLAEKRQAASAAKVPALLNKDAPAYTGPSVAARKDDKVKRDPANYAPVEAAPKNKVGIEQLREEKIPTTQAAPPSTAQATAASPDYGTMYSDILKAQPDARASLPKEIGEIEALEKEQGNRELESVKKREQGLQALTAKREERLAKREGELSQQEGLNPYMAMINAGLTMMQSTGKGLAGIAAGAEKGMGQFAEGVKLNTAQRQKIDDARDALDDLRFNQENMSEKERNEAYNRIKQGAVATRTATVSYIQHRDDVNAKTAGHIFDANTRQVLEGQRQQFQAKEGALERQSRAAIANASAAVQERIAKMPGAQERLFATLGGGDAKKGFAFYTAQTTEGKGDEALLAALVKDPMLLGSLPPDLQGVVTNTLRARLVPPTVKAPPASQVRAP